MMVKDPQPFLVSRRRIHQGNHAFVPCVYGLGMHAVQSGQAMIEMHESGRQLLSLPLARLSLESAINALWLVQTGEGLMGFVNEGTRQRNNVFIEMAKSANEIFREGAAAHGAEEAYPQSFTDAAARNFQQMTEALQGGHDAYLLYRMLSQYSHPGLRLVDEYLLENEESESGVTLITTPDKFAADDDPAFLFITVVAMMWGARALDHLQMDHRHRSRLRAIAKTLTAPETLNLTAKARAAYLAKASEQRRSEWKGPKPRRGRSEGRG